jgi:outer membrane protein OmpA-like peptidoglycan-associated protein
VAASRSGSVSAAVCAKPVRSGRHSRCSACGKPDGSGTSGLGTFLAGTEAAPRSFVFEKLNFDSAKSAVRAEDAAEIDQVAATLKQYGTARIRIAGYADARGNDAANMALGKARADSIKAALVAKGVDAARVETVSGGETDPVDSNATASGRFENRRTELVVTAR